MKESLLIIEDCINYDDNYEAEAFPELKEIIERTKIYNKGSHMNKLQEL